MNLTLREISAFFAGCAFSVGDMGIAINNWTVGISIGALTLISIVIIAHGSFWGVK